MFRSGRDRPGRKNANAHGARHTLHPQLVAGAGFEDRGAYGGAGVCGAGGVLGGCSPARESVVACDSDALIPGLPLRDKLDFDIAPYRFGIFF